MQTTYSIWLYTVYDFSHWCTYSFHSFSLYNRLLAVDNSRLDGFVARALKLAHAMSWVRSLAGLLFLIKKARNNGLQGVKSHSGLLVMHPCSSRGRVFFTCHNRTMTRSTSWIIGPYGPWPMKNWLGPRQELLGRHLEHFLIAASSHKWCHVHRCSKCRPCCSVISIFAYFSHTVCIFTYFL